MKLQTNNLKLLKQKPLLICMFIFLAGISTGIFFTFIIPDSDRLYLSESLQLSLQSRSLEVHDSLLYNLLPLALIFILGLSFFSTPLVLFFLFSRAAALGMCLTLISGADTASALIPVNILISIIYLTACSMCISYNTPSQLKCSHNSDLHRPYIISFTVLALITTITSIIEGLLL